MRTHCGMFVQSVAHGSLYSEVGIQRGDEIIGINGLHLHGLSPLQVIIRRSDFTCCLYSYLPLASDCDGRLKMLSLFCRLSVIRCTPLSRPFLKIVGLFVSAVHLLSI